MSLETVSFCPYYNTVYCGEGCKYYHDPCFPELVEEEEEE